MDILKVFEWKDPSYGILVKCLSHAGSGRSKGFFWPSNVGDKLLSQNKRWQTFSEEESMLIKKWRKRLPHICSKVRDVARVAKEDLGKWLSFHYYNSSKSGGKSQASCENWILSCGILQASLQDLQKAIYGPWNSALVVNFLFGGCFVWLVLFLSR